MFDCIQIGTIAYRDGSGVFVESKPINAIDTTGKLRKAQINRLQGFYEQFITDLINYAEREQQTKSNN